MNIKAILGHRRRSVLMAFYIWFLGRTYWPLFHKDLAKRNAVRVMEEDWDYLIVLDACRCDVFRELVDEKANCVISGATHTAEWMKWNFRGKYKDVIYIAGNPHFASANLKKTLGFIPFFVVKEVWDYGWDSSLRTVPPEEVTTAALDALRSFPEKRMIIHYNQPHHPFLSDKELAKRDEGIAHTLEGEFWGGQKKKTAWDLVRQGELPVERVTQAYKENVKIVMKEVEKLKEKLPGRVILTADHGDLFGEYGFYGHACGLRAEALVKVPWAVLKEEKRLIIHGEFQVQKSRLKANIMKLKASGKI